MAYLPITLGIKDQASNANSYDESSKSEGLSAEVKQKILEKDNHTCRFCGFKAKKYQEIHYIDGNHQNLRTDNLATACIYCHQCFDLEKVAQMRSGMLIWLPEIDQGTLNHIARAIFVSRISQGSMAETATEALNILRERRQQAQSRIHTDDPFVLSIVMRDFLTSKHYNMRENKLEGIRLLPLDRRIIKEGDLEFNQFPQILAYWRSKAGPFGEKVPNQWKNFYASLAKTG